MWRERQEGERSPTTLTLLENCYKHMMREKAKALLEEDYQFNPDIPIFKLVLRRKLFNLQQTMSKKDGVENVKKLIEPSESSQHHAVLPDLQAAIFVSSPNFFWKFCQEILIFSLKHPKNGINPT
ncbi:hypothetical protein Bbelb_162870 [Branchiostoma belcheri]|nr:hypothetical protein Bbelb_162870 [Branchiostoma belcheri]